ncbi:MAG: hypothetical protein MI745_06660 [Pseudomonadales bacterium]|nr:hypothetical protein [Pseudomonadales bacterium]
MGALTIAGALELARRAKVAKRDQLPLEHFSASEFGPYWPLMNVELLLKLDAFRKALGYPVAISSAPGAIGRPIIGGGQAESGAEKSWHNYALHGEIMAIDVHPLPPDGPSAQERRRWYEIAKQVGFTGIGIYPDWNRPGMHLDVRTDRTPANPATWAGVYRGGKQVYVSISEAFV